MTPIILENGPTIAVKETYDQIQSRIEKIYESGRPIATALLQFHDSTGKRVLLPLRHILAVLEQ